MSDVISINYEQARAMAATFRQGAETLQDNMKQMQDIAKGLEDTLQGRAGEAFIDLITGKLCPSINRLAEKFTELEGDVKAAVRAMREADRDAKGQFE